MALAVSTANYNSPIQTLFRVLPTIISSVSGVNPVNSTPQPFSKSRGLFTVRITNDAGSTLRFMVKGGWGNLPSSTACPGFWYVRGTAENCTVTFVDTNQMSVVSTLASPNNQTYLVTFAEYPSIDPTIVRTGGTNVTGNLSVDVLDSVSAGVYPNVGLS